MTTVPTVDQLKAQANAVRAYYAMTLTRPVKHEISAAGERLLAMIEGLPGDVTFCATELLDQVVSRALVQRAYDALNAGPGSAGIGKALVLLKEALVQ